MPALPSLNPNKLRLARMFETTGLNTALLHLQRMLWRPHLRGVYYHDVPPSMASTFEEHLRFYAERFAPVGVDDLLTLHAGYWPHDKPGLMISFDDGVRSHAEVAAPLLEKHGFIGWFFLPVGFLDAPERDQKEFAEEHRISVTKPIPEGRLAGADVITAQGSEAGGHTSHLGTLSFVRAVVKIAGDIPVVAAGGIADGYGLAAALMLGAEGVWIGTRFVASTEWAGPEWAKGQVVIAETDDTILTKVYDLVSDAPFPLEVGDRVIRNNFTDAWHGRETEMMARQTELREEVATASAAGDVTTAPVRAGAASGLIGSIDSAGNILRHIVSEAEEVLGTRPQKLLGG